MMDAIQAARQLGKTIQADDRYLAMMLASQKSEEDAGLQEKISDFNDLRYRLNAEMQKPDGERGDISGMNTRLRTLYGEIYENENMAAFSAARDELNKMVEYVNQIITGSTQGLDPETIEYEESCGGNCSGCSGCS